jgi:hypothetical protein
LGNFVASSVAGVLWTVVSPAAAFTFASIAMLGALALLAVGARGPR